MEPRARWIFGDQLGPHFIDPASSQVASRELPIILIESTAALRRRDYHWAKAQVMWSAMRHCARDLEERAVYIRADTYREGLGQAARRLGIEASDIVVSDPTSYAARRLVRQLGVQVEPSRGFVTSERDFADWAASRGRKRLLLEDFYRAARRRCDVLMDGDEPTGGRWNFDAENRLSPPKGERTLGLPEPWWPTEGDIDEEVHADLSAAVGAGEIRLVGAAGPRRFAVTRAEALHVLRDFVQHRLSAFGPYEDAVMRDDWVMAHSLLSVPMNLGLLDPMEAIEAVIEQWDGGDTELSSVEGFIRQVMGWRDYVWHLYWHLGENYVSHSNALEARTSLPEWWTDLRGDEVTASCLSSTLTDVRERGWAHHIPRLMILGNWALQQGYEPAETTEWFTRVFVDAYPWVMAANVVGMALYADGGTMATKPYAAGGAYINRMTNYCKGCAYRPTERTGERGCPFTAGYWSFLDRTRPHLQGNHRMAQPLRGLDRLTDLDEAIDGVRRRGTDPP